MIIIVLILICYQILHTCLYMPYKICMFQLLPGCNVACMQRYTVVIHRQGNTAICGAYDRSRPLLPGTGKAKVELLLDIQLE